MSFPAAAGLPVEPFKEDADLQRINLLQIFPVLFTLGCCLTFIYPAYSVVHVALEPAVAYFYSNLWLLAILLVIPPLIAAVHVVHMREMQPVKKAVIVAIFVPSTLIIFFADRFWEGAQDKADRLAATDCAALQAKDDLQNSWEVAYYVYDNCLSQTNADSGYSMEQLKANFRIQDCEEYKDLKDSYSKDWGYLEYMEEQHACSGWCYPAQQLWSTREHKDSCSVAASNAFRYLVQPQAMQVCLSMSVSLITLAFVVVAASPSLRALGYDW